MIRLALVASVVPALAQLAPPVQTVLILGVLGLLAGVMFGNSERPLQRLLALIAALKAPPR